MYDTTGEKDVSEIPSSWRVGRDVGYFSGSGICEVTYDECLFITPYMSLHERLTMFGTWQTLLRNRGGDWLSSTYLFLDD